MGFSKTAKGFGVHAAGAIPLVLPFVFLPEWAAIGISFLAWAWLREGAQHRDEGAWVGWWTVHRAVEGAGFAIGGCLAYLALSHLIA